MPTHIVVNGLGLTYKSTIGLSMATIPDVCKTPSPGGPVPIPYPNIATQSSLKSGTKTVKAKGNMIAVKGSQYGRSNGDEPGTAGGVKSNVNMKATDWITYSFDVKMDGKNACRHTDKKFHNNQNAADLCGQVDPAAGGGSATELFIPNIDCDQKMNRPKMGSAKWSRCQCQQYCKKIEKLEKARKAPPNKGRLAKVAVNKNDYNNYKGKYIRGFERKVKAGKGVRRQFMHKCAADEWEAAGKSPTPTEGGPTAPFNADHMHDAAYGGPLSSMSNFKMLDRRVNSTVGSAMMAYKPEGKHAGRPIKAHDSCNCPHGPED